MAIILNSDSITVSDECIEKIRRVCHFSEGKYRDLDIEKTLQFFGKKYVYIVSKSYRQITSETVVLDVGCGYGWLSFALVMMTGCRVIALDFDVERLEAARQIGEILGLSDRIQWVAEPIGSCTLPDRISEITFCIEVLEHVYRNEAAFHDLTRMTQDVLVLTTPNLLFPKLAHDTRLPFCHWLPVSIRRVYARLARRTNCENDNLFWGPTI